MKKNLFLIFTIGFLLISCSNKDKFSEGKYYGMVSQFPRDTVNFKGLVQFCINSGQYDLEIMENTATNQEFVLTSKKMKAEIKGKCRFGGENKAITFEYIFGNKSYSEHFEISVFPTQDGGAFTLIRDFKGDIVKLQIQRY